MAAQKKKPHSHFCTTSEKLVNTQLLRKSNGSVPAQTPGESDFYFLFFYTSLFFCTEEHADEKDVDCYS